MPVRSLTSSVIKWPNEKDVVASVQDWAREAACRHPDVVRIGYFGSYANGSSGVGSDVDLIVIVASADRPFHQRSGDWGTLDLPVPADVLVYTTEEWATMSQRSQGLTQEEIRWVYARHSDHSA